MKRAIVIAATLFASAAFAHGQFKLSFTGYGPVFFGQTLSQAAKALGESVPLESPDDGNCRYVQFRTLPSIELMVEDGIVTRIDATASVPNSLGLRVGMALKSVKLKFPKAEITPHQYDPSGHYVAVFSHDKKSAFVMEEGNGTITDIRAGLRPSVHYVERCL